MTMSARRRNEKKFSLAKMWQRFLLIIRVVIQLGTFFLVPVALFRVGYALIMSEPPLNTIAWAATLVAVVVVNRMSNE